VQTKPGLVEVAEGGTLFIDEIGEMAPGLQAKLLRVLENGHFRRVGGTQEIHADVRVVAATNRNLAEELKAGRFREDLFYRLNVVTIELQPLRERREDVPLLAEHFASRHAGARGATVTTAAREALLAYDWPGNVRELENALRAAALFAEGERIELTDFTANVASLQGLTATPAAPLSGTMDACDLAPMTQPSKIARVAAGDADGECATDVAYAAVRGGVSLSDLKRDIERECIARALSETGGNITRAAGLLGMKRPRLSQLVKQYGFGGGGGAAGDVEVEAEDGE
jgi:DNA-binding NtrC family response regulator